jgi:hypothetical protein
MAVFKVEKTKNFTIMSNHHLQNKNLSLKAKGLLSYMLSLPMDWDYSLAGLVSNSKESKTSIRNTLNELKENHYLSITKLYPNQTESKKIEYVYNIYEEPHLEPGIQKQDTENQYLDFQSLENDTQINTNIQNTKEQTDKEDKTKNKIFEDDHNFLTIDLIDRKYITAYDTDIYNYDKLFENLLNEYETRDLLIILHYIIPRVLDRNFVDENGEKIVNKFGYLKNSILNNIDKLKNNELKWDEELGWFKENELNQEEYDFDI